MKSSQHTEYACYFIKIIQIDANKRDLKLISMHLRKSPEMSQFYDKRGDIEISQMESSQRTEYACYFLKLIQIDANGQDLKLTSMHLRRKIAYFQ